MSRGEQIGLRDRIAYAIAQTDGDEPGMEPASCDYEMADAVIAELGMHKELGVRSKPDGPVFDVVRNRSEWGDLEKMAAEEEVYRYVTDWKAAELGLRREWGALDDEDNGILADTREELLNPISGETIKFRYVTDWQDADG